MAEASQLRAKADEAEVSQLRATAVPQPESLKEVLVALDGHPEVDPVVTRFVWSSHTSSAPARIEWEYWEADLVPGGFWAPMCPEAVRALEDASAAGLSKAKLSFTNERTGGDTLYEFDLDKLEQLNTDTKYRRTIRRTPALPRKSASACAVPPPHKPPRHPAYQQFFPTNLVV